MACAHIDPFQGGMVGSGMVSIPPIIMGIPSIGPIGLGLSGPFPTAHTTASPLLSIGGSTLAPMFLIIPPFILGGSGPSTSILTILPFQ